MTVLLAHQHKTEGDGASDTDAIVPTDTGDPSEDGKVDSLSVEAVGFVPRLVGWFAVCGTSTHSCIFLLFQTAAGGLWNLGRGPSGMGCVFLCP